ncbi:expressed unknown protein [Seminavis robusta]|uniref:NYN domain-containing protein n=1 Tax=Seminavis robusta TaxID=568900 RepID=A0A9N8HC54_9STRA|nr:expressed unknown protein [Seminavis robusta]|eukprot:Sro365_g127480.1 n/a (824) ;mRNA; r:68555-71026
MSSPEPFSDWLRRQQAENPHGAVTEQWATQLLALGASWDTFRDRTADLVVNDLMTVCDIPLLAALDIVRRAQDEIARSQAPLAVFWDLEQVPLFVGEKDDNGILCTETIRELQSLLKPYGSLQRFGCYGTLSNPRQQQLTLQLLGCQHVETSDNSSQEVTIAVDAMEFSHNHPDGAVVCFVTSEADRYAHLLATLQRRPHCRTMTVTTRVPSKQVQDMPKNTFWLTKTTRSSSNPLDTKIPIEKVVSFEQNQPQQPPPPLNRNSDTSSKTATNDNSQSQAHQTQTDTQFTHEKSSPPDSIPAKKETSHQDDDGTNKQVYTPTPSASAFESVNLKEWFKAKSNAANDHKDLSSSSSSGAGDNQQDDDYDDDDDNEADDLMSLLTQEEFDYPYYSNNSPTKQTSASSSNEDDNNNSIDNSDNNNNHHHRHDAEDIDYSDPTNRETWEQDVGYLKALIKRYSKSPSFSVRKDHVLSMLRLRNADRFPKKRLIAALGRAIEMGIVLEHSSSNELDDDKNAAVPTLSLPPTNGSSLTRPKLLEPADTLPHGLKLQLETIPERVAHVSSTMPFALFAHRRNFPAGSIMPRGPYVVNLKKDWLILMFRTQKDAQRTVDEDLPVALGNSAILVDCRRHPEFLQGAANNNSKRRPEENGEEEQRCPTPRSSVSSVPVGGKDQVEVLHGDTDAKKNGKAVAANCGGEDEKKEDHTVATNSRIDRGGKPKRNAVTNDGSNDNRLSQISLQEANQKQPRRQRNRRRRQSGGSNSSSPTQELSSPQTTSTTSSSSSVESSPGAGIDKKLSMLQTGAMDQRPTTLKMPFYKMEKTNT